MKIYFGAPNVYKRYADNVPVENFLASQIYQEQVKAIDEILLEKNQEISVIIDSGAFTAWNSGIVVSKEQYLENIVRIKEKFEPRVNNLFFVNLDVIPGEKGRRPSMQERVDAAEQGWKNYLWFREHEITNLIHVYHMYEDLSILKRMIDNGCIYIGISPENYSPNRLRWLETVFKHIDESKIMTHGFGVTADELVLKFPWTSVDSISYVLSAGMGNFSVFNNDTGTMKTIKHSDRKSKILSWEERKLQDYLFSLGTEYRLEDVAGQIGLRMQLNVLAFLAIEKFYNSKNVLSFSYKNQTSFRDFLIP